MNTRLNKDMYTVESWGCFVNLAGQSLVPVSPQFVDKTHADEFLAEISKHIEGVYLVRWEAYFKAAHDAEHRKYLSELEYCREDYSLAYQIAKTLHFKATVDHFVERSTKRDSKKNPSRAH